MAAPSTNGEISAGTPVSGGVIEDAYQALLSVGHSPLEARDRLDKALAAGKEFENVNDLLMAIYAQK
jgi:Holliday junction DNA helicase RuvA